MNIQSEKRENILLSILINIVIPTVILTKFSTPEYLGHVTGLWVALSFPFGYGLLDLIKEKKVNFFSLIGIISISLTGGFALMELETIWFAVKEAAIPTLFGIAVLISVKTETPIVEKLLLNPAVINLQLIEESLSDKEKEFKALLFNSTVLISLSFALSAVLNFVLAVYILKSPSGTSEFNAELGKMNALSLPVITIPSMLVLTGALLYLVKGIKKLTNLELNQILVGGAPEKN